MRFSAGHAIALASALVWGGLGALAWSAWPKGLLTFSCNAEGCDPLAVRLAQSDDADMQAIGVGMLKRIANALTVGEDTAGRAWLELARLGEADIAVLDLIDDESVAWDLYARAAEYGNADAGKWLESHPQPLKRWAGAHGNWEAAFNAFERRPTCYITSGDADTPGVDDGRGQNMIFFTISPEWLPPMMQYSAGASLAETPPPRLEFFGPDGAPAPIAPVEGQVANAEEGYILFGGEDGAMLTKAAGAALATVSFTRADGASFVDRVPLDGLADAARDIVGFCGAPPEIVNLPVAKSP